MAGFVFGDVALCKYGLDGLLVLDKSLSWDFVHLFKFVYEVV